MACSLGGGGLMRAAFLLALAAAIVLAGCGRRGSPERPPIQGPAAPVDPADPDGRQAPDREFILDPILD
ncbi:MAG: lipoprotein [Pseudomonadota bacterium]